MRAWMTAGFLLCLASSARAQDYDYYGEGDDYMPTRNGAVLRNQIDLELVDLLSSSLSFRYERSLNRWISLALHPSWWWGINDVQSFDFGVALQMRWYPEGHAMRGWYLSPQLGYYQVTGIDAFGDQQADHSFIYTLVGGYNWIMARSFSLYFGAGIAYAHGSNTLDEGYWHYYPVYAMGPFPVVEFGIGIPF